jgi:peptidyl-prolyl cis-trans isomerase C
MSVENPMERKLPVVPPDTVVLSVGDFKLTAAQFDQLTDMLPDQNKAMARGPGRKQFGDNLVRMLVLADEAKHRKLNEGSTYEVQAVFQLDNLLASLMYQQLNKDVVIPEADLKKYYDEHKAQFEQVSARHILIRFQGSRIPVKPGQKDLSPEESLAKAQDLEKRIQAGEDFAKLASTESDDTGSAMKGGDLGFFRHGAMVPSFEEAAFKLQPGQVSEPIKSEFGYHIIKVEGVKTFADVKSDVEKTMAPQIVKQEMDDLQKKSTVVFNTEFFNTTPPPPPVPPAGK